MDRPPTRPALVVNGQDFSDREQVSIGRHPRSDILIDDVRVSRDHARIEWRPPAWVLIDRSTRGTYLDGAALESHALTGEALIRLADPADGPTVLVRADAFKASAPATLGRVSAVHDARASRTTIGRASDNDIVLADLRVSRYHAELGHGDAGYELRDLESHNGTFVNGQRMTQARLSDGDIVSIGSHVLRFADGRLQEYDERGETWLLGSGLTVATPDGRRILDGVDLAIPPSTLVALVGPSGAGKTTLLGALAGFKPADSGTVWYGGRDLYAGYDDIRQNLGLVPQSDIIHTELTVSDALRYAAELRFPADVDRPTREARVDEVISDLGLAGRVDVRIESLSGGQRKRVSVALELLTRPSLLYLDEPTSGLDPANEAQVVSMLTKLAAGGRIVVVATHSIETVRRADRVLFMAPGGRMAFYGPPEDALVHFASHGDAHDFADVFRLLEDQPDAAWVDRYKTTQAYESLVRQPLATAELTGSSRRPPSGVRAPVGVGSQLVTLLRRYLQIMASDRRNLLVTALQAPFFGLLIALMFPVIAAPDTQLGCLHQPSGTILVWLMVIGATWLGASNAIREVVKELPIYRRERSVGLSLRAYLGSKAIVLGSLTAVQTLVMVGIVLAIHPLPSDPLAASCAQWTALSEPSAALGSPLTEIVVGISLGGIATMCLALFISAVVTRGEKASALLPYILIAQTLLSQPFIEPPAAAEAVTQISSARWSLASVASTLDLNRSRSPYQLGIAEARAAMGDDSADVAMLELCGTLNDDGLSQCDPSGLGFKLKPAWTQNASTWLTNIAVLIAMSAAALAGAAYALRRHDVALLSGRRARMTAAAAEFSPSGGAR